MSGAKLRRLTVAEVADRAGVGTRTVLRLEAGEGAAVANTLRIARALGVLDSMTGALDPTRPTSGGCGPGST